MNLDNVFDIINAAITNFNQSTDQSYNFKFDEKAVLFGKGSVLDSIGLVNFVVAVEEEIENSTGKIIVLGEDIESWKKGMKVYGIQLGIIPNTPNQKS